MKNKMKYIFLIGSLYYIIMEAISAFGFHDSIINTYTIHTISELGIPGVSQFSFLMNSAFIVIGLTLLFGFYFVLKDYIVKNNLIFHALVIIASVGVIIVGLVHGGNPLTSGYHTLGAVMAILGGNLLLVILSKSMANFGKYQKFTLFLGIMGLLFFWIMFFNMDNIYMPVLERASVYTLILWNFMTGIFLANNNI